MAKKCLDCPNTFLGFGNRCDPCRRKFERSGPRPQRDVLDTPVVIKRDTPNPDRVHPPTPHVVVVEKPIQEVPSKTEYQKVKDWRLNHPEEYRAYQRDYMRQYRLRKKDEKK